MDKELNGASRLRRLATRTTDRASGPAAGRTGWASTKTTVVGAEAYPDIHTKAAALLHSLCLNHALVDGNKRLAWTACQVVLGLNGEWVTASEDDRFDLVVAVASGAMDDVHTIAAQLRNWCD